MSHNSDAKAVLAAALRAGLDVRRVKHGGYALLDGETVVARVPTHGGSPHWIKNARRAIRAKEQAA